MLTGALLALAALSYARPAAAAEGALASVNVAATAIGDGISPAVTGAFAYQFTDVVGLGVEVMWVPTLTPKVPALFDAIDAIQRISPFGFPQPGIRFSGDGGRAVIVTSNVRLQLPTASGRLVPYVIAGGGVGTVREERSIEFNIPASSFPADSLFAGLPPVPAFTGSYPISNSFTDLALTLGGGVNIYTTSRLAIDVDLRYLALLGARDVHIGRFGGGITYKF